MRGQAFMREIILILGGTKEAAKHAADLVKAKPDARIITSLAGRTREPEPVAGEVRIGGFGGASGLADYIRAHGVTQIIDATHPFAKQISQNARMAADLTGVTLDVLTRPPWSKHPGDNWIEVASLEDARDAIPANARILLALGSQHIAIFASRPDVHFVVRMVDPPQTPLPLPNHSVIVGKPGTVNDERALLAANRITHIVCRNSGGTGAYAKIQAARQSELPVIIVQRSP